MKNLSNNNLCQDLAQNLTKIFQDNIKEFDIDYVGCGIFEYGDGFVLLLAPFDSKEAELTINEIKRVAMQNSESIIQTIKQTIQENDEVVEVEFDCEEIFVDSYDKDEEDSLDRIEISLPFRVIVD